MHTYDQNSGFHSRGWEWVNMVLMAIIALLVMSSSMVYTIYWMSTRT